MSERILHIISLDVPFPADYGGAIDIYYRVKALHELGVKVYLHCYEYGRGETKELEEIAEKVYYYKRWKTPIDWLNPMPFIVQTRRATRLIRRLERMPGDVLFEGLHTTYFLSDERLKNRVKLVRTHNIEHHYYHYLSRAAKGWKKRYFRSEAEKLKRYEAQLTKADHILAIKDSDRQYFSQYQKNAHYLPASIAPISDVQLCSTAPYVLFHGNLSVPENDHSARWLIEHVFPIEDIPLFIAGKNPSEELIQLAEKHDVQIFSNPSQKRMETLICEARVHALRTDQSTGIKLKLIQSLQSSAHVLVNREMIDGTGLNEFCHEVNTVEEWKSSISEMVHHELPTNHFEQRVEYLKQHFDTEKNCELILRLLS